MSLLGDTWDDPRTLGLLAAAQAMMQQRGVGGLLSGATVYGGALAQAKDKERAIAQEKLKQELLRAQIEETRAQGLQRTAQMEAEKEKRGLLGPLMERLNSGGAPSQYGVGGGGIQLGGVREQMTPQPGGIAGFSLDDVVRFEALTGRNVLDHWKTSRTGQKLDAGQWYQKPDGTREYIADPVKGIGVDSGGGLRMLPNAANVLGTLAGATKEAETQATNRNTLFTSINKKGEQEPIGTVADVQAWLRQNSPLRLGGNAPRYAPPPTTAQGQDARLQDVASAEDEIRKWAEGLRPGGGQGQQEPSPIRTSLGSGEKLRDEAGATASKEFITGVQKRYESLQSAQSALDNIENAKKLVSTASPFMGPFGQSKLEIVKFLNQNLGTNIKPESVNSAEELRSRTFLQIMDNLKKMDSQPSQYQQKVMQDALGNLGTDPRALAGVLDTFGDIIKGKVTQHNKEVTDAIGRGTQFPFDPRIPLRDAVQDAAPKVRRFNLQTGKFED